MAKYLLFSILKGRSRVLPYLGDKGTRAQNLAASMPRHPLESAKTELAGEATRLCEGSCCCARLQSQLKPSARGSPHCVGLVATRKQKGWFLLCIKLRSMFTSICGAHPRHFNNTATELAEQRQAVSIRLPLG